MGRRADRLDSLAREHRGRIIACPGDVTDPSDRASMLAGAKRLAGGRLDLLVNNAGSGAIGPFDQSDPSRLRKLFEVDFFAATELTREALPMLRRSPQATLCNVGSVLGHRAVADKAEYCAAKFAMHGWTDAIRLELTAQKIRVLMVSPSTTRSEFFDSLVDTDPDQVSQSIGSQSPDQVARAAFHAIRKGRRESILSLGGKSLVYADRLAPGLMDWILRKK